MVRGMNKKGMEMAINTVVILVLAIVVLVFLVLFFTNSSGEFAGRVKSYFSYSNVDRIVEQCNLLVDLDRGYTYCCEKNEVRFFSDGERDESLMSCGEMVERFGVEKMGCEGVSC
ncbi:hypothetical protein CMI38_01085 [Candidatus Pacearchaeota archaeon]|nr:hypothetical protein [Candidatus Pacearchaeota archaeon]|tara:strand:- start:702 stop:1046 length:345 start_codon:yes stop_codon:yes gene_type:complete